MKIVSWNLRSLSHQKLGKTFLPLFQSYGLGNTVLDFIVNVVMGSDHWEEVVSPFPPDVFVIVELKTGGTTKGAAASERCLNTLAEIRNAMNKAVRRLKHSPTEYTYEFVRPLVTGYYETVGFIYNTRSLTPVESGVERDTTADAFLTPRSPSYVTFSLVESAGTRLRVCGVHAPPPTQLGRGGNQHLRRPIDWCVRLANTPTARAAPNVYIAGDFNCQPSDKYRSGSGGQVGWAAGLPAFQSQVPDNSLSSVRRKFAPDKSGQAAYLNAPFDNTLGNSVRTTISDQEIPDLIGKAKAHTLRNKPLVLALRPDSAVTAYNLVSDHLPVVTEFTVHS